MVNAISVSGFGKLCMLSCQHKIRSVGILDKARRKLSLILKIA